MSLPVHLVPSLAGVGPGRGGRAAGPGPPPGGAGRGGGGGERGVPPPGAGTSVLGAVASTGKRVFAVTVESVRSGEPAEPSVAVVQALPKGDRGELAVEVLTEVGVASIVPWAAARSVAVWKGERAAKSLARWRSTAREAAKQARRSWFPEVGELASTAAVAELVAAADLAVVLHEEASAPLASVDVPSSGRIVVVVGPEGGLTDDEVAAFVAAGAVSVRLGAEVLRTSTAGVAAVSALLSRTDRWR